MQRGLILLFLVLILAGKVSGIIITEIELNPTEGRDGTEWIELYNNEEDNTDISGWKIFDGLASEKERYVIPENTLIEKGEYYIIEFGFCVLNNDGDYIIIYDSSGEKVDETKTLKETSPSSKTWQLCENWEYLEETKGEKNNCVSSEEDTKDEENFENEEEYKESEKEEEQEEDENSEKEKIKKIVYAEENSEPIEREVISLGTKNIKTEINKEVDNKKNYAWLYLVSFCFFLGLMYLIKGKFNRKNEFR